MIKIKSYTGNILLNVASNSPCYADLSHTNLSRADLCRADLSDTNLRESDLSGADLSGANLSRADLCRADLRGANLSGADLSGADLSGADLRGANIIIGGQDERGFLFYATGNANLIQIRAGCQVFSSVNAARAYWESQTDDPYLNAQCLAFINTIEKLASVKGWAKTTRNEQF